jgi:hypothetical protein
MDILQLEKDMSINTTLEDVFQRAHLAGIASQSVDVAFQEVFTSPEVEQLCSDLLWHTFTTYFSRTDEHVRDGLVATLSESYTDVTETLIQYFPPKFSGNVVRSEKDLFLTFLPFLLGEAVFVLLHLAFPGSAVHFEADFRDRLDVDFNLMLGGVKLCSTTQAKEKERMFGARAFAWDRRKSCPVNNSSGEPNDFSDYTDESDEESPKAAQSTSSNDLKGQLPLQEERQQYEQARILRRKNRRLRPQTVKFNTNLMSPVLQRGLERHTAIPTWRSQRMISHSMPLVDLTATNNPYNFTSQP